MLQSQIICHFELKISLKGLSRVIFMRNLYILMLIYYIIIQTTVSNCEIYIYIYTVHACFVNSAYICLAVVIIYIVYMMRLFQYEWCCEVFKIKLREIKEKSKKKNEKHATTTKIIRRYGCAYVRAHIWVKELLLRQNYY